MKYYVLAMMATLACANADAEGWIKSNEATATLKVSAQASLGITSVVPGNRGEQLTDGTLLSNFYVKNTGTSTVAAERWGVRVPKDYRYGSDLTQPIYKGTGGATIKAKYKKDGGWVRTGGTQQFLLTNSNSLNAGASSPALSIVSDGNQTVAPGEYTLKVESVYYLE